MKRTVLLVCTALTFATAAPPAHAIFGVGDIVFDPTAVTNLIRQFEEMQRHYTQIKATADSVMHGNNIEGTARRLLGAGVRSPGSNNGSLPGLMFGRNQSNGADQFLQQNRYHDPQGDDFGAQEMRRQARANANIQAEAQAGLDAVSERRQGLEELMGQIDAQPDVQASAGLGNRIAIEQAFINNERDKIGRLQLLASTNQQVTQQRAEERARKDAEEWRGRAAQAFERQW